jgi:hypothetical protein
MSMDGGWNWNWNIGWNKSRRVALWVMGMCRRKGMGWVYNDRHNFTS